MRPLFAFPAYFCNFASIMTPEEKLAIEEKIVTMLRTVYDPEIPVDIYSLGLIYKIDLDDDGNLRIDMTLTAPNCPAADFLVEDARIKLESIEGIKSVDIRIVFEPEWNKDMMSDEAKLDLGFM
jgi:Predicted metal-sulfur cluster biosynthetic enzyme